MIKIEINCLPDELDAHYMALGLLRDPSAALRPRLNSATSTTTSQWIVKDGSTTGSDAPVSPFTQIADAMVAGMGKFVPPSEEQSGAGSMSTRQPGHPSPGKKRRTGAEVAEDEAYFKANPQSAASEAPAAISTGEERRDSAAEAQDEADEAAETAARKTDKLTLEDVRAAVAKWAEKVGPADAIKKLRDVVGCTLLELPESDYAGAISRLEHSAANPGSTVLGVVTATEPELTVQEPKAAPKTKEDVIAALMAYGQKYDGSTNPEAMANAKLDLPKVFSQLFGDKVTGLGSMPKSPEAFGQIVAAIEAATRDNPFKREVKA